MNNAYRNRKRREAATADLRPGEHAMPYYCSDIAGCGCETLKFKGVPCTSVARADAEPRTDRCLNCGAVWLTREYAADPLVMVRP